jgi:hypothetical protein
MVFESSPPIWLLRYIAAVSLPLRFFPEIPINVLLMILFLNYRFDAYQSGRFFPLSALLSILS